MEGTDKVFGGGKRNAEKVGSSEHELPADVQRTYGAARPVPSDQKEDARRRNESGQGGGERNPEPVEKGDARRDRGGPGQQGEKDRPDAPEGQRGKRGSKKR